ncbi:hypothetical protein L208DRAFT_1407015 [Tricholoma matsutake]|nr:hypothetical protein L208DRAFT_1407015 [Tricholoma matsutake 945]
MFCLSLSFTLLISLAGVAHALSSCVAFDIDWNLLAFGFNGKDYNAGPPDTWTTTTGTARDMTVTGRPPFNGPNVTCYLSQYTNAIYILGADASRSSALYIYDASANSWSTQTVNTNGLDPASFGAILDHDTNVFYALSHGELYSLDMALMKVANSTPISWADVQKPSFNTGNYAPIMALAQNHIYFLGVPGVAAGSALIFVIHYSFLQPTPQPYGNIPATHGQAASFFQNTGVQQEFAFIPDDCSATYVINVETNTTQTLKGPTVKDPSATYFASNDSLVQLSASGSVYYLPYTPGSTTASWSLVSKLPSATTPGKGNVTNSSTSTAASASSTSSGSGRSSGNGTSGTLSLGTVSWGMAGALLLSVVASLL